MHSDLERIVLRRNWYWTERRFRDEREVKVKVDEGTWGHVTEIKSR